MVIFSLLTSRLIVISSSVTSSSNEERTSRVASKLSPAKYVHNAKFEYKNKRDIQRQLTQIFDKM